MIRTGGWSTGSAAGSSFCEGEGWGKRARSARRSWGSTHPEPEDNYWGPMRRILILLAALVLGACGGDDDGGGVIDASSAIDSGGGGGGDGGTSDIDAAGGGGGTQGPNQFCETLESGGPYCMTDLECCDDHVCRYDGDCPGDTQFLLCDCTADCPTGLCCDVGPAMDEFCTKRSACNDYDGDEDTTCP